MRRNSIKEGFKKSDFYHLGGEGGQQGSIITFYFLFFFVPNVLKIISRHLSFFMYRVRGTGGHLKPLCFGLYKGENTPIYPKVLKNWSSFRKTDDYFKGGFRTKSNPYYFLISLYSSI